MLILDAKIKLYIPSIQKDGSKIEDRYSAVLEALYMMNELFGGSTVHEAEGAYTLDNGVLMKEKVTIIESWSDKQHLFSNMYHSGGMLAFAQSLCKRLNQESILVEADGKAMFVRDDYATTKEILYGDILAGKYQDGEE